MSRTVLLATDDGRQPAYAEMRGAALSWARDEGHRVVLYDRSAESYFVDPYPSGTWTADVADGPTREQLLTATDLEILGRHYLAEQVRLASAAGSDISAWLPPKPGPAGMVEAVERFGADLVILPTSAAEPTLFDRVRGNTLERFRSALTVEVALADASGVHLERTSAPS